MHEIKSHLFRGFIASENEKIVNINDDFFSF